MALLRLATGCGTNPLLDPLKIGISSILFTGLRVVLPIRIP